ncbi:sulfotransferase family protein [Adhaeribacter soli]|uniref:Sulfotransferase family protein n=1 Tax=Adhaeribacter soli TaxID=2607655 RepID=A0A5N1IXR0_9BACT|nr:sulfotransferase family protein [Adhaeribacter soli]KAA9339014.1 sulfotransferase family protein [Adhaeribacter soli]
MTDQSTFLTKWIPYKLKFQEQEVLVNWLYVGDKRFSEPFFDETISKCLSLEYNSKGFTMQTSLEFMIEAAETINAVEPSAFIFHVSRCGSTLLAQMLDQEPSHIVLAEVPFFDDLLRLPYKTKIAPALLSEAFQAAIRLMGQRRTGTEHKLFIKLDSWHLFFYDLIQQLYPEVPKVFLYRRPLEVLRSHRKHRGMQAAPGVIEPQLFGFPENEVFTDLDVYTGRVLERYFEVLNQLAEAGQSGLFLDYASGASAMFHELSNYLNLELSPEIREQAIARSTFHSKFPDKPFGEVQPEENLPPYLLQANLLYESLSDRTALVRKEHVPNL